MNYSKNLLKKRKKSTFVFILGILLLLFALTWIPVRLIENEQISGFDIIYVIIFLLNGIVQILAGRGISPEKIFGEAYINIDEKMISIKPNAVKKGNSIQWKDISFLNYNLGKFSFTLKNQQIQEVSVHNLEYSVIQDIKKSIASIAKKKEIPFEINELNN